MNEIVKHDIWIKPHLLCATMIWMRVRARVWVRSEFERVNEQTRRMNDCAKVFEAFGFYLHTCRVCKRSCCFICRSAVEELVHMWTSIKERDGNTRDEWNEPRICIRKYYIVLIRRESEKNLICINDMYDLFNINVQWQTTHTHTRRQAARKSEVWVGRATHFTIVYINNNHFWQAHCNRVVHFWNHTTNTHRFHLVPIRPADRFLSRAFICLSSFHINSWQFFFFWHFGEHWRMRMGLLTLILHPLLIIISLDFRARRIHLNITGI